MRGEGPWILTPRAQAMTNRDGKPRWIKYTSLGWRIELDPPAEPDQLTIPITRKEG